MITGQSLSTDRDANSSDNAPITRSTVWLYAVGSGGRGRKVDGPKLAASEARLV